MTHDIAATDRLLQDAIAAYRASRFDEVESCCQHILAAQPHHIASVQLLAAVAANKGETRRGIALLEEAVSPDPECAEAYVELAKLLRVEGQNPEAVAALRQAIELRPDNASAYNDLGLIHLSDNDAAGAKNCFDRAVEISPDLAIAHYNKGLALERQGFRAEATASFRRVTEIAPDFAEAHAKLGNLLLIDNARVEALAHLRRAAAVRPDSGLALMCEAKILMEDEKTAAAEEAVGRAIEQDPQNSDAHCLRGSVLMELGRFQDAAAAFDLALALNRQQTGAYHELVHVKKLTEADRPLLAQIEWLLGEAVLAEEQRADLHFALGKAYDDLGEYKSAIDHFDDANRLKHRTSFFAEAAHGAIVDRLIEKFTPDFFGRNSQLGIDSELPILVLGMPRSGTTLVEQILSSHPDVAAAGELSFWGERAHGFRANGRGEIDPKWAEEVARDYRSLLEGLSASAHRVTDKRPQNFHCLGLIHAVFPRARIIHCRRHPVDTCLSIYFQNFARRIDFAYDRGDLVAYYRQYERLMAHWRAVLPPERFLELQYEELVENREAITRQLIAFCGLEWDGACLHSERNARPVRTASLWQARQPIYQSSVARWRNYRPWLGVLQDLLPSDDAPTQGGRATSTTWTSGENRR
jgi:tetratricopeptide (TPR) repeat protein